MAADSPAASRRCRHASASVSIASRPGSLRIAAAPPLSTNPVMRSSIEPLVVRRWPTASVALPARALRAGSLVASARRASVTGESEGGRQYANATRASSSA